MSLDFERLKKTLVRHEGLKLKPYKCSAGKWTIGVGRNIEDRGITLEEAMVMLMNDINICLAEAHKLEFFIGLDSVRQEVIVNMIFNLGMPRLLKFKNFLAAMAMAHYDVAAREMLDSNWARQVGPRALELASAIRSGKFSQ